MKLFRRASTPALLCFLLAGCQSYESKPLVPLEILEEVERTRLGLEDGFNIHNQAAEQGGASPAPSGEEIPFTFARAAKLMSLHSPALRVVVAEYQTALGLADVATPLPNPTVEAGPKIGLNMDKGASNRVQPLVSLGFAFPLSGRLGRQDDVNQQNAELSYLKVLVKHRRLYMDLRLAYTRWILAQARLEALQAIIRSMTKALELTRELVKAGLSGALDVGQMDLDLHRGRLGLIAAKLELSRSEAALSRLLGVHTSLFHPVPENILPELHDTFPDLDRLKRVLAGNGLELAVLRGEYEVAECRLRLEIAKQYPDLALGAAFEREPGETQSSLDLTVGIELPIFDRNQQNIAVARRHREEIREKYTAAANLAFADLEQACRNHELAQEQRNWVRNSMLPRARSNVVLARKSVAAATIGSLQYLEIQRAMNAVLIEEVRSELELRDALIDIEQAVGRPLWLFPSEREGMIPPLPYDLDEPTLPAGETRQTESE